MNPIITDTDALGPVLSALHTAPFIAIDTEFLRESTYYPQLCLIQLATPDALWLIDPLANHLDLTPLWHALNDATQPIVFHAAEQDLELMHLASGTLPRQIHDTQIAASLLGLGEQMGYARLVLLLMDHDLDKSQSRTNWSTRPLTSAQCQYAADDVRFLRLIYPDLLSRLAQMGRGDWFDQECAGLNSPERFQPNDDRQWRRVRGQQRLNGGELALLQAVASWREQTARKQDLPRRWVLSDDLALELAVTPPTSAQAVQANRLWPKQRTMTEAENLFEHMELARQMPTEQWPQAGRYSKPDPETASLLVLLQEIVQQVSQTETIAPSLLATTDDLLALIRHPNSPHRLTTGWRDEVIGARLKSLLP
ncbi:MAG: ribonuclease D [Halothiobacillus sp.]|jgi:ribonuclease D|nr:ribonuclease D [Halothiobacillus sp.]